MRGLLPVTFTLVVTDKSTLMHLNRITYAKRVKAVDTAVEMSTGNLALKPKHIGCLRFNSMNGTLEIPVKIANDIPPHIVESYTRKLTNNLLETLLQVATAEPPKVGAKQ